MKGFWQDEQLYVVFNNNRIPILFTWQEDNMCISVTFLYISVSFLQGCIRFFDPGIVGATDAEGIHSVFQHPAADAQ